MKDESGKPQFKPKSDHSLCLSNERSFKFEQSINDIKWLFIGIKANNISYLSFKSHRNFSELKSIYVKKERGL